MHVMALPLPYLVDLSLYCAAAAAAHTEDLDAASVARRTNPLYPSNLLETA